MKIDRTRVNDRLTSLMEEFGVIMDDDALNELTHHVADVMENVPTQTVYVLKWTDRHDGTGQFEWFWAQPDAERRKFDWAAEKNVDVHEVEIPAAFTGTDPPQEIWDYIDYHWMMNQS